jgi:hypothetical protein
MKTFERVTGIFTGAVAATALFAAPACSQDARSTVEPTQIAFAGDVAPNSTAEIVPYCIRPEGYPRNSCATQGYETERTLEEIMADPALEDVIVLHFGAGLMDAGLVASVLNDDVGYPAVAIPGGPEGRVQLIIAGYTTDRMVFDQDLMNMGRVGNVAQTGYPRVMARKEEARREAASRAAGTTTLASASPSGAN